MRARSLFIGTLGLSLAIHGLIFFAPLWPAPKPTSKSEIYRVELIQEPLRTAGNGQPDTTPVSTVIKGRTKALEDPVKPRPTVPEKSELSGSATEKENDQSTRQSEKTSKAASRLKPDADKATDSREAVRTVDSTRLTNSWSPGAPQSSFQDQRTDHQRILSELSRLLYERLRYPEAARRKGIEGAVAVTLTLNTDGTASDVTVFESSGSRILDRAALRAITDIFPYSDPPDTPLHLTIPVTYRMTEPQ